MLDYNLIKFYKSVNVDFEDSTKNGGESSDAALTSGELSNTFDETTASQRENGDLKRIKLYVENGSDDRKMKNNYLGISLNPKYPDSLKIYEAKKLDNYGFTFDEDVASGTEAGTKIAFRDATPDDVDTSLFKGRRFKVGNMELVVDDVDSDNSKIWFTEDTTEDISSGDLAATNDEDNVFEADEDWDNKKYFINAPIVDTLSDSDENCQIPANSASDMEVGDAITIVDNYRRPLFRGVIKSIDDGDNDDQKKITFDKAYKGNTIPARYGYLSTSITSDILPGQKYPFWVELTIGASNALTADETSSYQLVMTFDDVKA